MPILTNYLTFILLQETPYEISPTTNMSLSRHFLNVYFVEGASVANPNYFMCCVLFFLQRKFETKMSCMNHNQGSTVTLA